MKHPAINKNAGLCPALMTESKPQAAKRLRLRLDESRETNQIVPKIYPREARSK